MITRSSAGLPASKASSSPSVSAATAASTRRRRDATSPSGGWYATSGGMAELLREKAQLTVKVIPGGGTQNPVLVQKGDAEIGMGLPPLLDAAMKGEDPYQGHKMPDLRALAGNMSLNTFHF